MTLKAYRWKLGTRLECLGDLAVDAPIGNATLAERQREVFVRAGFELAEVSDLSEIPDAEFLLFSDNLYVSWPLFSKFLKEVRRSPGSGDCFQMGLCDSAFTRLSGFAGEQPRTADGTTRYRLYYFRLKGTGSVLSAMEQAQTLALKPWIRAFQVPFSSRIPTMTDLEVPVTDAVAFELTSWVHLWMANLCYIGVMLLGLIRTPQGIARLLWSVFRGVLSAWSLRPFRILTSIAGKLVVRGRGCKIHPSAVVEASVLGRNVEIGPLCVVRGSILGDGVQVMEQCVVDASVLGDGVMINQQGMIKACVAYPEAVFSWMQAGLVGRRSFLGRLCRPLDMKYQGEVRVKHRGALINTGLPFLGCCIGHRSFISADSRLLPGRAIPNDYKILSDFSGYIDQVPEDLPTDWLLLERAGKLERFIPAKPAGGGSQSLEGARPPAGAAGGGPPELGSGLPRPPAPGPGIPDEG